MRFQQLSAVDDRAERVERLDGGCGNGLPKADACQVVVRHIFARNDNAAGLRRHIHAAFGAKAEILQIIVHGIRAHPKRQRNKHRVAGFGKPGLKIYGTVGRGTADGGILHLDAAVAGKGFAVLGLPGIQRRRHGKYLEDGAGVVGVRQNAVAAQFIERFGIVARRAVQIIALLVAQRQDLSGVGVHGDAHHALGIVLCIRICTRLFHKGLDDVINGKADGVAVGGRHIVFLAKGNLVAFYIGLRAQFARRARQVFIVVGFYALQALAVYRGKAQHLG